MLNKVVLASQNTGKLKELNNMLADCQIELICQAEFNVPDVEETGLSFIENAIIKARHAAEHTHLPALADDSGLCVEALENAPGVYSARYAGSHATDHDRIAKLLQELAATGSDNRGASFYCALALVQYPNDPAPIISIGKWSGTILDAPRGEYGFGYDPIFYVAEYACSAGELAPAIKNQISHRARAIAQFKQLLQPTSYIK